MRRRISAPQLPKGITRGFPGSPLPASMGEQELEVWEQWWGPELPGLGLGATELARQHAARLGAWRGRSLPSSPKGAPFPDWPALPTSRNLDDYRHPEMITQSSYAELLQLLTEESFFVTEVTDLILRIFLTTGKNRRPVINKRGFGITIFSFLFEFYVYL